MRASKQRLLIIIFLLTSCSGQEKHEDKLPITYLFDDNERTVYEGKWNTPDGVLRIELFLKTEAPGVDSQFELHENLESIKNSSGTISLGKYTVFYGLQNDEVGIRLNNLPPNETSPHFRRKKSWLFDMDEEMYFISRGSNELLPSDKNFKALSTEHGFALNKRSKPFTVEGYITFEADSADFFERNTFEHWTVSKFGEYDTLQIIYRQMAKEKFQGIYLKALAYTISNNRSINENNSLVIKRILTLGDDPDSTPAHNKKLHVP